MRPKGSSSLPGQSLTEYGLIGGLVVIAAAGGLWLLRDSLSDAFAGILSIPAPRSGNPTLAAGPPSENSRNASAAGPQISLNFILSNGRQISLSNYPASLASSIETAGTNGTTETLLAQLSSITDQLKAQGQLSEQQQSLLTQLANQGHEIANIEKLIEESYIAADGDMTKFDRTPLVYGGQLYSPHDLSQQIGFFPEGGQDGYGPIVEDFKSIYQQLDLEDPVVREMISILVNQIINTANGVESALSLRKEGDSIETFHASVITALDEIDWALGTSTQASLMDLGASALTRNNSSRICKSGDGQSTGTSCE